MTLTFTDYVATLTLSAVGAAIGVYLVAYVKQKGENPATKEDLQLVVDQVKATTLLAEGMKTEVSGKRWISQERWKVRMELYVTLLSTLQTVVMNLNSVVMEIKTHNTARDGDYMDREAPEFTRAKQDLMRAKVLAGLVSPDVWELVRNTEILEWKRIRLMMTDALIDLLQGEILRNTKTFEAVATEGRRELGFSVEATESG
jgi:hypothetical protein